MKLSTRVRYAARALTELGMVPPLGTASIRDVADGQNVSPKYLESIFSSLRARGLIRAVRPDGDRARLSVGFYLLDELLHEMRRDADVAPQRLRRKKYFNVSYLVVDEVGFEPMSHQDASLFFRLVSYRYMPGSTAITTNKSVKDWPGICATNGEKTQ